MNDLTSGIKRGSSPEVTAILAAVDALPPSAPTACIGWNAHHVAAQPWPNTVTTSSRHAHEARIGTSARALTRSS
jgi:hypothetical protein